MTNRSKTQIAEILLGPPGDGRGWQTGQGVAISASAVRGAAADVVDGPRLRRDLAAARGEIEEFRGDLARLEAGYQHRVGERDAAVALLREAREVIRSMQSWVGEAKARLRSDEKVGILPKHQRGTITLLKQAFVAAKHHLAAIDGR